MACDCPPMLFKDGNKCCLAPGGVACVYSCTETPTVTPGGAAGTEVGKPAQRAADAIGGVGDFLNRLWQDALGNPSFWKFTGLIAAGVLAVLAGGYIFLKDG